MGDRYVVRIYLSESLKPRRELPMIKVIDNVSNILRDDLAETVHQGL